MTIITILLQNQNNSSPVTHPPIKAHLVIWRRVVTRTRSFSFSRLTKIPMKLMKANSTKARKTMEKQSITYLGTRATV